MGLVFGPDDQDGFVAARDALVAEFVSESGAGDGVVAEQVLEFKWQYLDGDLVHWSAQDVDEVLFGLYPAKVIVDPGDLARVAPGFASFLRFLATRADNTDRALFALADRVDASVPRFVAAMTDEDNWSFGKRLWAEAAGDGVDLGNHDAVQAWMREFNARPLAERDQVLGRSFPAAPVGPRGAMLVGLPPVMLAPEAELRAAAGESVMVGRLIRLVEFVGSGRPVTDRQHLKLADGKALVALLDTGDTIDPEFGGRVSRTRSSEELTNLDWTYRVALGTRLLRFEGRRVVPGEHAGWVPDELLDLFYGAFLVVLHTVGPTTHHYRGHQYGFDWYAEELDRMLSSVLFDLYRAQGPVDIDDLTDTVWDELLETFEFSDISAEQLEFHRESVDWSLRRAFDRLAELGAVRIDDELVTASTYGTTQRAGGTATLEPLGVWATQRVAARVTDAPVVGALRDSSAIELLTRAADLAKDLAHGELDAWIATQPDPAVQLCAALPHVGETARGLGYRALLTIGVDAADAVAALHDTPTLTEFVTVFRIDTRLAAATEMDRSDDPSRWVELLATVIEIWGPDTAASVWPDAASGTTGIDAMLEQAWRVPGDRTEVVLSTLGAHHPDKKTAKAARKALFKHRSAP